MRKQRMGFHFVKRYVQFKYVLIIVSVMPLLLVIPAHVSSPKVI